MFFQHAWRDGLLGYPHWDPKYHDRRVSGMDFVACDSWMCSKPQMRVDFRYIRKTGSFWTVCDKERRLRSRWGREIQNCALHVFSVRD